MKMMKSNEKMNGDHHKVPQEDPKALVNNEVDDDPLEKVLQYIGGGDEMGRYMKWMLLAMLPLGFNFAFVYFVQMFVTATPQRHWCRVPELAHLDNMELRRNLTAPGAAEGKDWDRCVMFDVNWTQVLESLQPPPPDTPTVPCQHGWEFELGDIPYHTIVSERGWVCERASYAPTAQSIFFIGSMTGGLLFGCMADQYGRVPALVAANLVGCAGGLLSIFTVGLWDFAVCRFLVGMSNDNGFMLMYILVLEYLGARYRTVAGNLTIAFYFGMGSVLLPWLAVWIADWRQLLLVTSLPMLIVIGAPFVVPESTRWLISRGRVDDAVKVLRKFERVNKTKIPDEVMEDFIMTSRIPIKTDESLVGLAKSPPLRLMMLYLTILAMSCALVFDGFIRMSETLGFDFFITFTLTSVSEIPAAVLLVLLLDRWGRRSISGGPTAIAGVLAVIAGFVPKGIPQVVMAILARFFVNMSAIAIMQWTTELLPTGVRATASSLLHLSAFVSIVLSPFIVYSERYWGPLPMLLFGTVALVASGTVLFLPETKGRPMTQTIADGERLMRSYKHWSKAKADVELEDMDKRKSLIT